MASILSPFKKIINATATEIIDSQLPTKVADVLNTLVISVFEVVDDGLVKIQDLTKSEEPDS